MTYRVIDHGSHRAMDLIIPGADRLDPQFLENLILQQTEETLAELREPEFMKVAPPHDKGFQHDLGKVLVEIEDTNRLVAATGHGRYY